MAGLKGEHWNIKAKGQQEHRHVGVRTHFYSPQIVRIEGSHETKQERREMLQGLHDLLGKLAPVLKAI